MKSLADFVQQELPPSASPSITYVIAWFMHVTDSMEKSQFIQGSHLSTNAHKLASVHIWLNLYQWAEYLRGLAGFAEF